MAPVGALGQITLNVSTKALAGDNQTYTTLENQLSALTQQRDALAGQIVQLLEAAEFNGQPISFKSTLQLVTQAVELLYEAQKLQR